MSLPIKETPILRGKNAKKFLDEINRERTPEEKAKLKEDYERAKEVFDSFKRTDEALPSKFQDIKGFMADFMDDYTNEAIEKDKKSKEGK